MTNSRLSLLAAVAAALLACGPAGLSDTVSDDLSSANGLTPNGLANNGLANNGLANNGLANNGLANNGLANNGLATTDFSNWFNQDPALADVVMKYVVKCALPTKSYLKWKNPATGVWSTWYGELGLAPDWSAGKPATVPERQIITACLASLTNKFGVTVPISLQGRSAVGTAIPLATDELKTYSVQEGCFFGNLFDNEGIFVGLDHTAWSIQTSSARACALDVHLSGSNVECPPLYQTGYCRDYCKLDPSGTFYASCSWNGVTYAPLTTRLRPQEVYTCGDGICQFTESCGSTNGYDACKSDCGYCP